MDNARRINSKKKTEIKATLAVLVNPMLRVALCTRNLINAATDALLLKTCFSSGNKRIMLNVLNKETNRAETVPMTAVSRVYHLVGKREIKSVRT